MQLAIDLIEKHSLPSNVSTLVMEEHINSVKAWLNNIIHIPLKGNEIAALVSLVSDIGTIEFSKSQLLIYLNKGNMVMAANEFMSLAKEGRVMSIKKVKRRRDEKELFLQEGSV